MKEMKYYRHVESGAVFYGQQPRAAGTWEEVAVTPVKPPPEPRVAKPGEVWRTAGCSPVLICKKPLCEKPLLVYLDIGRFSENPNAVDLYKETPESGRKFVAASVEDYYREKFLESGEYVRKDAVLEALLIENDDETSVLKAGPFCPMLVDVTETREALAKLGIVP